MYCLVLISWCLNHRVRPPPPPAALPPPHPRGGREKTAHSTRCRPYINVYTHLSYMQMYGWQRLSIVPATLLAHRVKTPSQLEMRPDFHSLTNWVRLTGHRSISKLSMQHYLPPSSRLCYLTSYPPPPTRWPPRKRGLTSTSQGCHRRRGRSSRKNLALWKGRG